MAFIAPLIAPFITFAGTTAGAATIAAGATIATTGMMSKQNKSAVAAPITSPTAPQNYSAIVAQETKNALKRSQAATKTILTNPLGVSGSGANIQRKTLLGT